MSTLAEQVAALQPGDVERLITLVRKAKEIAVVLEAERSLLDFRDLEKRLMALRNLTPAQPVRPDPEIGTYWWLNGRRTMAVRRGPLGGPFKTYLKSASGSDEVAWADACDAVQALPPDMPAEPPCPFEIGATVWDVEDIGTAYEVSGWSQTETGNWYVDTTDGGMFKPERLSLTMPEPPIWSVVSVLELGEERRIAHRKPNGFWYFAGSQPMCVWSDVLTSGESLAVLRWGGAK